MDRTWYIYALVDPRTDDVRYVGWAFDPNRRLITHVSTAKKEHSHKASWIKQLLAAELRPTLRILEQGTESWADAEKRWIAHFKEQGARLTNLTTGGDGTPGHKWTEEQLQKVRGRVFTPEHRAKIAAAKTGLTIPADVRQKLSEARKGTPISPEQRQRLIVLHTGKPLSDEHKAKISAYHKGRVHTPDEVARMAATLRGRKNGPPSEETRRKLSASKIGQPQLCGICKSPEHNRRTCSQKDRADG